MKATAAPKLAPHATAVYRNDHPDLEGWSVKVVWSCDTPRLLNRTDGMGWLFGPNHKRLAERLVAAINAGVVFGNPELRTDVNGRTYVSADVKVLGRTANADLKRLGF